MVMLLNLDSKWNEIKQDWSSEEKGFSYEVEKHPGTSSFRAGGNRYFW